METMGSRLSTAVFVHEPKDGHIAHTSAHGLGPHTTMTWQTPAHAGTGRSNLHAPRRLYQHKHTAGASRATGTRDGPER